MSREIELHEVLRDRLGAKAAKMLSESIYRTDLVTKADLKAELTALDTRLEAREARLRSDFQVTLSRTRDNLVLWMFGMIAAATLAIVWTR